MKKTLICGYLVSLLSITASADDVNVSKEATNAIEKPAVDAYIKQVDTSETTQSNAANSTQDINCHYHIPAETTKIDQTVILNWAKKATQQSFNFDYKNFIDELNQLKACYTEQGFQGFNEALKKSGNSEAIQTQLLTVSSTIDGKPTIIDMQQNQWKVSLPLQVIYKNDKDKLTQQLTVDLVIGRKISGDLGIMQLIASPRHTLTSPQSINASSVNTSSNTP